MQEQGAGTEDFENHPQPLQVSLELFSPGLFVRAAFNRNRQQQALSRFRGRLFQSFKQHPFMGGVLVENIAVILILKKQETVPENPDRFQGGKKSPGLRRQARQFPALPGAGLKRLPDHKTGFPFCRRFSIPYGRPFPDLTGRTNLRAPETTGSGHTLFIEIGRQFPSTAAGRIQPARTRRRRGNPPKRIFPAAGGGEQGRTGPRITAQGLSRNPTDQTENPALVGKANLLLGRMDIDVHQPGSDLDKKHGGRITAPGQNRLVSFEQGLEQGLVPDRAAIDEKVDMPAVGTLHQGPGEITGQADSPGRGRANLQQLGFRVDPEHRSHPVKLPVPGGQVEQPATVVLQLEADLRVGHGEPLQTIEDRVSLGVGGFKKLLAGRDRKEQVGYRHPGSHRGPGTTYADLPGRAFKLDRGLHLPGPGNQAKP